MLLGSLLPLTLFHLHLDKLYVCRWDVYYLPGQCDKCLWSGTWSRDIHLGNVWRLHNLGPQLDDNDVALAGDKFHDALLCWITDLDNHPRSHMVV